MLVTLEQSYLDNVLERLETQTRLLVNELIESDEFSAYERLNTVGIHYIDERGDCEERLQVLDSYLEKAGDVEHPLRLLETRFGLSNLDICIVTAILASERRPVCSRLFALLNHDADWPYCTPRVVEYLFKDEGLSATCVRASLSSHGPLMKHNLVRKIDAGMQSLINSSMAPLSLSPAVLDFLFGVEAVSEELVSIARFELPIALESPLRGTPSKVLERCREFLLNSEQGNVVSLVGPPGTERLQAVRYVCSELDKSLIVLRTNQLIALAERDGVSASLEFIRRDSILRNAAVLIDNAEIFLEAEYQALHNHIVDKLRELPLLFYNTSVPLHELAYLYEGRHLEVGLEAASREERLSIWTQACEAFGSGEQELGLEAIAERYEFTRGQIEQSLAYAVRRYALARKTAQAGAYLVEGCTIHNKRNILAFGKIIQSDFSWRDLSLQADVLGQLQEFSGQVQQSKRVLADWNLGRRIQNAAGISALFSGASGTGKTMAASVIANELKLDLLRIDLSKIVSKYIGETEKNLAQIFEYAHSYHAVLFFDEADALFGKRSEVRDAHDRYANLEVNFLLQRIEEHPGISILASNLSENMDEAFLRRFRFIVEFPFPVEEQRKRIWCDLLVDGPPISNDIDFDLLAAAVKLPGGGIRNVVLNAAYRAVGAEKHCIEMQDILFAVKHEYEKANQPFIPAEFGPHRDLFS